MAIARAYPDADEPMRRRIVELARTAGQSLARLLADVSTTTLRLSRFDLSGIARDACEAATCEKQLLDIPDAGHSFDEASYPQLVEAVDQWLKSAFGATAS